MGSNFTVFESAISALSANNQALSVAANNIANVNTPGYSRQKAILISRQPQVTGGIELGLGVDVESILSTVDRFAELRLQDSTSSQAEFDAIASNLQQIETAFNEIGRDGLAKAITGFFNSFHDVANDPTSIPARDTVINQARILIERFGALSKNLNDARTLIDGDIREKAARVNSLAQEIADLNVQIKAAGESTALTLRDQRQVKVREIAEMINVNAVETSEGIFQLYIGDGFQLVNGERFASVDTAVDPSNGGFLDVTFRVGNGASTDITGRMSSGAIYGLVQARDNYIAGYQGLLNELAYEIATEVNAVHVNGYDLDGNTLVEFFNEDAFNMEAAVGADLATELHNASGANLRIEVGDVINFSGTVTGAIGGSLTVAANTTLNDIAAALQAAIRAAGAGTETAAVQADGSILVTAGATAITNLQMTITGKAAFNAVFTYPTPIAIAGTGDSGAVNDALSTDAARLLELDSAVESNSRAIAASGTSAGLPGDNANALLLAALQTTDVSFSTGSTPIINFYSSFLSQIGNDSQTFQARADFSDAVYRQAEIQREKISGVSLEEEQLNIVRYQSAFQAASRLVNLAKDVLDVLVNLGQ